MPLSIVILAAGSGSRMNSQQPKVLHQLAGKALIEHVLDTVAELKADNVFVICGHQGELVKTAMAHRNEVIWVVQKEQLGTGHAVQQVLPQLSVDHQVLILYGDVPMITSATLQHFVKSTGKSQLGLLTATVDNPSGLGRVIRDEYRQVTGIVEERDASDLQKQVQEINSGIYCVYAKHLQDWLPQLNNQNSQGEYYLTDIVKMAREHGVAISVSRPKDVQEIYGANIRAELAKLERCYQYWQARDLMLAGVTMFDPARVDIRGVVVPAQDCIVDVNVIFEGKVTLGKNATIGPNCIIRDSFIEEDVVIEANSVIDGARLEAGCHIGPFARIRPNSVIKTGAKVGNFVEVKKATLGVGSKANHLSYIGDAIVGANVNIGAGVITCNYDGANKHQTVIEDEVFIGSDCQLVAPVTIAKGATVGAGTTVTQDVPADTLALGRCRQSVVKGWRRPTKKSKG